ncbi:MAG: hypothetical protein NTZ25_04360 [Candidatus Peregrinibacteria bacterium]|nr:hypothetical protein [Candidatus Peregrinibacteria bacterium]
MAIFKYTIANKDGKKLSGSVEAPDENTARLELENLGFSILLLQETKESPQSDSTLGKFAFEAIDKNSRLVSGTIPSKTKEEAIVKLQTEYELNISAIWPEGSTNEQIEAARKEGQQRLQTQLQTTTPTIPTQAQNPEGETKVVSLEQEKKNQFIKEKIELTLKAVNELIKKFDQDLAPDKKVEINKKIDKLLRIKNSTNVDYILESANELLKFLEEQEKSLKENVHQEKRFEFQVQTQKMLQTLNQQEHQKNFSEDLTEKIQGWQKAHLENPEKASLGARIINSVLVKIQKFFTTPPEIAALKMQISSYNKQLWEFAKLYFKEPTPEYKTKVKNTLKTIWQARKRAIENLKILKQQLKGAEIVEKSEEKVLFTLIEEMNAFTGWLLGFYVIYYIVSLYLNTKDFGLSSIPTSFHVYETHLFKYILVITFLLHSISALKVNFFRNSAAANIILPPIFVFGSIITLLNF